jgi:hypothetical protein
MGYWIAVLYGESRMYKNPNPKKYVVKIRRGKPILVDKQIIRWRTARRAAKLKEAASQEKKDRLSILDRKFFE